MPPPSCFTHEGGPESEGCCCQGQVRVAQELQHLHGAPQHTAQHATARHSMPQHIRFFLRQPCCRTAALLVKHKCEGECLQGVLQMVTLHACTRGVCAGVNTCSTPSRPPSLLQLSRMPRTHSRRHTQTHADTNTLCTRQQLTRPPLQQHCPQLHSGLGGERRTHSRISGSGAAFVQSPHVPSACQPWSSSEHTAAALSPRLHPPGQAPVGCV